jgi:hypothetical protein
LLGRDFANLYKVCGRRLFISLKVLIASSKLSEYSSFQEAPWQAKIFPIIDDKTAISVALGDMKTKRQRKELRLTTDDAAADLGTPMENSGDYSHNETLVALHRARFVDWSPTAATASAVSGDGTLLAVARESGNVELWQTDHWSCITVGIRHLM